MTESTAKAAGGKANNGWTKPYPEFPLSYHPPSGRLYKKIKGTIFLFSSSQARVIEYKGRSPYIILFANPGRCIEGSGMLIPEGTQVLFYEFGTACVFVRFTFTAVLYFE